MKELICICCPRGCHLQVDDNLNVTGNFCPRGAKYGKEEISNPTRVVTSTVRISNAELAMCPVKTENPIPKGKIFDVMKSINEVRISAPVKIGDIIIPNVCGTGVNVISTRDMEEVK